MRFTYNQYKYNESGYRIPSKIYNNNTVAAVYQHLHHKTNFGMRMTMSTASTMTSRIQRKGHRTASKRHPGKVLPGKLHSITRIGPGKLAPGKRISQRPHPPPCDNSNDSGLGFDQHVDVTAQQQQHATTSQQQMQLQQSLNQQQSQNNNTELCNIINSNSSNSNSSTNYHHHNYHNHHMQPQHLIRAIPSSSKNQDEKDFLNDSLDDNFDTLTSDLDDCFTPISVTSTNSQRFEKNPTRRQLPVKRKKHETHVDLDNDDACSEDAFVYKMKSSNKLATQSPNADTSESKTNLENGGKFMSTSARNMARVAHKRQPAAIVNNSVSSHDGQIQLEIVSQPEQQHRARYQTEGSRGAVKDRSGNGFPIVRLVGYNKPAVLQVFIGTDIGRVAPHMFYQACKVAGKNSTQCSENKVDGTMVIEIDFRPESDMTITCDCVGILKERNVDVEHRFPEHLAQKNKKKSTRCRMVFRTVLTHNNGSTETLQLCSNPIICTQPPGVPEICKKSLNSSPVDGGLELFIVGKNFLKDTHVVFQESYENSGSNEDPNADMSMRQQFVGVPLWEQSVLPDKEYLQQTHLICTVPPYINQNIIKPITVLLSIVSSGKKSEPHSFVYTPKGTYTTLSAATPLSNTSLHGSITPNQDSKQFMETVVTSVMPPVISDVGGVSMWPVEAKHEIDSGMMPPPITTQMPMTVRRPSMSTSTAMILPDKQLAHFKALDAAEVLKTELMDESSQGSLSDSPIHTQKPSVPNVGLQFHTNFAHEPSHQYKSNTMPPFSITPLDSTASPNTHTQMEVDVMAAAVEMAVKNEIANEIQQQQHVVQVQEQAAAAVTAVVDEILSDLNKSSASGNGTGPSPTTSKAIETALSDILQQAGVASAQQNAAAAVLGRSLSISNNLALNASTTKINSPHSPINSLGSHLTTAQDLLMNHVEPAAATLKIIPMPSLLAPLKSSVANTNSCPGANAEPKVVTETVATAAAAAAAAAAANANGLSTDIIMNPAVSPSTVLSSSNGVATAVVSNIMSPHQVTMANSILNDIAMQVEPTQEDAAVAALALSNIMMSPTAGANGVNATDVTSPVTAVGQSEVTTATSTAVSNLIIKAAADLISNQEQQQQQQQQHHQQQHAVQQKQRQQQQQQCQQHNLQQHSTNGGDPLVNLLLSHTEVPTHANPQMTTNVDDVATSFPLSIPPVPITSQESPLIVALATDSGLQKSVAAAAVTAKGAVVTQQTTTTTAAASIMPTTVGVLATASVPIPPPIPQELTTMSDQDLLSYINPSTFDQI